jgi:hypothetical protein
VEHDGGEAPHRSSSPLVEIVDLQYTFQTAVAQAPKLTRPSLVEYCSLQPSGSGCFTFDLSIINLHRSENRRRCEIRQGLLFIFLKILFRPLYFRPAT